MLVLLAGAAVEARAARARAARARAGETWRNKGRRLDSRGWWQQRRVGRAQIGIPIDGAVARIHTQCHRVGHHHVGGGRSALVAAAAIGR